MTDMTPEEINHKIAEYFWPGIMADKDYAKRPTDYYRSSAAMDLLVVLVERGYGVYLVHSDEQWECEIVAWNKPYGRAPTIPAAICHAILGMIEREAAE